jgi:dipeptide/tripeptide permease
VIELALWNAPLLSTAVPLYVALFILVGAPGVVMETGLVSYGQLATPDPQRVRAFGAMGLAANAGSAVGMLAAGLLSAPLGLSVILNAQALLYLAAGAVACRICVSLAMRRSQGRAVVALVGGICR